MGKFQKYRIGTKVRKEFDGVFYDGMIVSFKMIRGFYKVRYEDDDAEELEEHEIDEIVVPTTPKGKGNKKGKGKLTPAKKTTTEQKVEVEPSTNKRKTASSTPAEQSSPSDVQSFSVKEESSDSKISARKRVKIESSNKIKEESEDVGMDHDIKEESGDISMNDDEEKKDDSNSTSQIKTKATDNPFTRAARRVKSVNYIDDDSDSGASESDDEPQTKAKSRKTSRKTPSTINRNKNRKNSKKRIILDGDEESFAVDNEPSNDDHSLSSDDEISEEETKPTPKRTKNNKTTKVETKPNAAAGKPKVKMSDAFQPMSTPIFSKLSLDQIAKEKAFLDPCGMEATDDIIDRLVGDQLDKIGSLLHRSILATDSDTVKFNPFPLQLGTACSGTDAPALALTLIQEQMQLRGHKFDFEHVFSCENEPFKQAYLARNFSSILYPDITQLPLDDSPRDVFGQPQTIPPFNMFVAGTSCKNFSMLRSRYRIDIEDKGCSGETFLAATEVLFKEQPHFAIFENVIGAPWEKMKEYITGRVKLSNCDDKKAVKMDAKDKKKDLIFCLDEDNNIVVDQVPSVYGVRCRSKVKGFLSPSSSKLRPIVWPGTSKGKNATCTLTELMSKNKISKKTDTLVFDTPCTYCTHTVKVDTKEYGLPQTRMRTYMFVWKPENDNIDDDLGEYWEAIVKFVRSPVRHSLESFILEVDHDVIRVFREALNGPAGRQTKRGHFMEPDFWTSAKADLRHNKIARERLGFEDMTRTLTKWGPFGAKQVPPHYWLEYLNLIDQREIDLLEILHASAVRDAETHDSNFASFFWNVSQNASKEKHRSACPGIAGCITPGGEFFLPHAGRPLLGCEKLLLQGIPYFRLALGNETEVQIGDLAGNAMSLTVVCATMLGAVMAQQLRKETMQSSHKDMNKILKNSGIDAKDKQLAHGIGLAKNALEFKNLSNAEQLFKDLASLAPEAVKSSIWCTCETSGRNSLSEEFLQCRICRVSCCRDCCGSFAGYQLDSHDTFELDLSSSDHNLGSFQNKLRNIAPATLIFDKDGFSKILQVQKDIYRVDGLEQFAFNLHRIKRDRKKWLLIYYARENNGVGEAVAEFRITVGELKTESLIHKLDGTDVEMGMRGELKSFKPAKSPPFVYGLLEPCAVVTRRLNDSSPTGTWLYKSSNSVVSLIVEGNGKTDSMRTATGITQVAEGTLKVNSEAGHNKKTFASAQARGESRRWVYTRNWMEWPESVTISSNDTSDAAATALFGEYKRVGCRQTINQSALWIRAETDDSPCLYLMMMPEISRTGPDTAIISTSISYKDSSSILAVFPSNWQPCDALVSKYHTVRNVSLRNWKVFSMKCNIPESSINVTSSKSRSDTLLTVDGLKNEDITMLSRCFDVETITKSANSHRVKLNVTQGQKAQQTVRVFNAICVAPILKYATQNILPYDMGPDGQWMDIRPSNISTPFGCCQVTIPPRPKELWYFNDEREVWERQSEAGASRKYYLALQEAPQTFEMWLDKSNKSISINVNPEVPSHHSAAPLIEGRHGDVRNEVQVQYKLADTFQQSDPILNPFKVSNCDEQSPTDVSLNKPFALYDRQQKAVTKMTAIENSQTDFEELEMSEQELPGSTGWSLIARATRNSQICGGVIADCIGAGKTVVSIAIMLKGLEVARASRALPRKSSATMVVVPPGLIDQWKSELNKFTKGMNVVCIYDFAALKRFTVQQIVEADVVIAPIDILESKDYLFNVINKTSEKKMNADNCPKLPTYTGQQEKVGADGVWIPASSQDPYGGANNSNNQKRRNESAHYTFIYLDCIQKLRSMEFKKTDKGVPLEYYEWERVFVDEIHESLCTTKDEMKIAKSVSANDDSGFFQERNRRAGRELLGITEKNIKRRPLVFRKAIFGLTGTPLLDSSSRVIELANLMGNTYVIGLSSHWRKLERESSRDIFLHNYLEPKQSREIRRNIYSKCQEYLKVAALRNKSGDEMNGIELVNHIKKVKMTKTEEELYLKSQSGIDVAKRSFSIQPEDFDVSAGHDISKFLRQNSKLASRGKALVDICRGILSEKGQQNTKIIVFTDGRIGSGETAKDFLCAEKDLGCTWLDQTDSVEIKNKKISWYQNGDATAEDKKRPRVLVLHFVHAAGLNLQTECNNLVLFTPLYVGEGGSSSDPVADASTELQAIGRVFRAGQTKSQVNVYRIEIEGPNGEECLDGQLIRRNTNEDVLSMAVNSSE